MTVSEQDGRRRRLRRALDDAATHLASVESALTAARTVRANGADDDEHDPDGIPLSSVLQSLEAQQERAVGELRELDAALTALEEGRYGICVQCGRLIPPAPAGHQAEHANLPSLALVDGGS